MLDKRDGNISLDHLMTGTQICHIGSNRTLLVPNMTNRRLFKISFQYTFAEKNILKTNLENSQNSIEKVLAHTVCRVSH